MTPFIPPRVAHRTGVQSVMVIDDSSTQRQHAVALCRAMGISLIYEAADGQDALAQLELLRLPPDLLLVDLHMPVMDGIELIGHLHQRQCHIPLVVTSSQPQDILDAVHEMCGVMDMPLLATLGKPLVAERLRSVLAQHLMEQEQLPTSSPHADTPLVLALQDLSQALECDHIRVHYQPKVDMRTGLVRGMEVLARWQHPQHGWVPPGRFVALAEKEGLIYDLTQRVMHQAFAQAADWKRQGFLPSMAINLSPHILSCSGMANEITAAAAHYRLEPSQVVLEITESAGIEHLGQAIALLTRLRLHGFGLSIDDYGTGFSSMQQLARLPFTELKIDRSFVHGAHQRRSLAVILESALEMAKRLGVVSVAEGVETLEDWRLLQRYGCNIAQGYLVAKPMPPQDIPAWMRQYRTRLPALRHPPVNAATPL